MLRFGSLGSLQVFLAESAASAVTVEMSLHRGFLARSGVTEADLAKGESSPTCQGYVDYLLASAHTRSYPVSTSAMLRAYSLAYPCPLALWSSSTPACAPCLRENDDVGGMASQVLLAALLPCFWLYMHVGVEIATAAAANPKPDHPYQEWIDMYSGDGFATSVRKMQLLCNEVAAQCTPAQREEMTDAYMRAARYEWMFFDAAHRLEQWPLALGGK